MFLSFFNITFVICNSNKTEKYMATISYYLSSKIDKTLSKSQILLRLVYGNGMALRAKTRIFISPERWKDDGIYIPSRLQTKEQKELLKSQNQLNELRSVILDAAITIPKEQFSRQCLDEVIDKFYFPDKYKLIKEKPNTLFEYINEFIKTAHLRKDKDTGRILSKNSLQQYLATYKHLQSFATKKKKKDFDFEDVNTKFYEDFVSYLQGLGFTNNSIGKHIKVLKTFINEAPISLKNKADLSKFKVFTEDIDTVFLDEQELQNLCSCNLTGRLAKVRDWFLLLAWTGCRYSDSEKISNTDIKDGFITFRQQKTNEKVTIPIHPAVIEVLEKYNYQMPKPLSNQRFNEYIKEVAKVAGIDQMETITKTVGGILTSTQVPKYSLIGSHTGRRSFCTNMYLRGIPTYTIMAISGHRTEKSFLKYLRVSKEEHAKLMKQAWANMYSSNTR